MTISVIICTKERFKDLTKCIESIIIQTLKPDELIIVDASKDNFEKVLREKLDGIPVDYKYIHSLPGLTRQRNQGIDLATGDIILFLDDDVILDSDHILKIMEVYKKDPGGRIKGVSGFIEGMQEPLTKRSVLQRIFLLPHFRDGKFLSSGHPTWIFSLSKLTEVEVMLGCDMSFRREVFNEFKFDERMQGYCYMEDDDFSYRVSRKYKLYQSPFAKLRHCTSEASRSNLIDSSRMQIFNHYLFFRKNMPKNIRNIFCFLWSTAGTIFVEILFRKDRKGVLSGFSRGILDIVRHS